MTMQQEEAKQRRAQSNRESARRSRLRKQQYIAQIESKVNTLSVRMIMLSDEIRSKDAIIQTMKEATGIYVDDRNTDHNLLRSQFLSDVCEYA
uniref:BZIP domain-containing protein n=1 Tax=Chenopodium quinoa TaxID=63459 RepID=A0A803LF48_CHEQI